MQYIKHYYVNEVTGAYLTTTNDAPAKRHPINEFQDLAVKIWSQDLDGIDVCLSTLPDETPVTDIENGDKYSVKVITEAQFNSVVSIQDEINSLLNPEGIDEETMQIINDKIQEIKDLINTF